MERNKNMDKESVELSQEQVADFNRIQPGLGNQLVAAQREGTRKVGGREEKPGAEVEERRTTRQGQEIPKGWTAIEITGPQQIPIETIWPEDEEEAEKYIKKILAQVEISKSDLTQQTSNDLNNAQSVLEILETKEISPITGEKDLEKRKKWAHKMRYEIKARIAFHNAFSVYENKGSIKEVSQAALSLAPDWFDVIFALQEEITGTEKGEKIPKSFNPLVEALQYYEDHGHEFARANSEEGREGFGKKAQQYLALQRACLELDIDPTEIPVVVGSFESYVRSHKDALKDLSESQIFAAFQKNAEEEQDKKFREFLRSKGDYDYDKLVNKQFAAKEYEWASNMAERLFRFTGRGIMYDYLVINKGKIDERAVGVDYEGKEKPGWAGGRDGCDYPMSKIYRFREFLKAESGLLRSQIELLDGVDIYGGDFWTRTVKSNAPKGFFNDIKVRDRVEPDYLDKNGRDLYQDREPYIEKPDPDKEDTEEEKERRRMTDNNFGERVGHLNFRLLRRETEKGEVKKDSFSFIPMGAQVMSLWAARYLDGPEEGRKALCGSAEAFLLNPTFDSLGKLLNAFEYSKAESWQTKKHLLINFIKYGRGTRVDTGKRRLSEDEIIAGVNRLTGITDENAPQFVQLPERIEILKNYFGIKVPDSGIKEIKEQAKIKAKKQFDALVEQDKIEAEKHGRTPRLWTDEERNKEIEDLAKKIANKDINDKLSKKIEKRIGRKFGLTFAGWFLLGVVKEALKQGFNLGK